MPVMELLRHRAEWTRSHYTPWPRALRDITLSSLTARALRADHLPPQAWIFPTTAPPVPAFWNPSLLTEREVNAMYATRSWDYLARRVHPLTFDVNDRHFQPFLTRYDTHLDHWAQAYWEATHELPVPHSPASDRWRRRRNSRCSHAGDHLMSAFQLLVLLFQAGWADMGLLLDVMMLMFPPGCSSVGRWYPDLQNSTLE
ncbi:hypothetical protein PHMEG_00030958, partial [Phytophthora megakarya]